MNRAVRIDRHGGPEEMKIVEVTVGEPGPGEIRIRHKAVGLNFIDVYQRTGLYPLPMPAFMGNEASGIVEAVGPGVTHLKVGDRAAYASRPPGAYCDVRVMPADLFSRSQGRDVLMTTTLDGRIKARLLTSGLDMREPAWGPYVR